MKLAHEIVPPAEAQLIETIKEIIAKTVRTEAEENKVARRDAHAKAHGLVKAKFVVEKNLPTNLQQGLFKPGTSYEALIRYSNGSGKPAPDKKSDGRGMAIKVLGVPGPKILPGEKNTQDFLMINHHVFFVRNAVDYVEFSKAASKGNPLKFLFPSLNPLRWRLHEFKIVKAIQSKKVTNPLNIAYTGTVPFLFGEGQAVRFSVKPQKDLGERTTNGSENFLREAMIETLTKTDVVFDFFVQVQTDPQAMPIEDPTIEWSEVLSPQVKIAEIHIPKQEFDTEERRKLAENLSFTPWHCSPDLRPLGGINRVRKVVYEAISQLRHDLNKEPLIES